MKGHVVSPDDPGREQTGALDEPPEPVLDGVAEVLAHPQVADLIQPVEHHERVSFHQGEEVWP